MRVERRTLGQHSAPQPRCVAASGACPPEDVGGLEWYLEVREKWSEWGCGVAKSIAQPNMPARQLS
ncbi:IS1096 element passenger TnpR family protein [Cupriavidus necator]